MTGAPDPEPGRRYAGLSPEQRRADRRQRLREACLQLVGTQGWAATTVQGVCSAAGVTARSFYEEHGSLVALLADTYRWVLDGAHASVAEALAAGGDRVHDGLAAYLGWMTGDPRRARLAHREVRVAGVLDDQRHAGVTAFAEVVARASGADALTALALTGAVNELVSDWVETGGSVADRVGALRRLFAAALPTD